jgi:hypothetical protein
LVKIHLLFRIMILIQWSVNISVFVNHVVIVFWGPNEGDRKRTYIPHLFSEPFTNLHQPLNSCNRCNYPRKKLFNGTHYGSYRTQICLVSCSISTWGRPKAYIYTPSVFRIYADIQGWITNENMRNKLNS